MKDYLDQTQILEIRSRLPKSFDLFAAEKILTSIDGFVRSNGKADAQYEALQQIAVNLSLCLAPAMEWNPHIKDSFAMMFLTAYFDMLVLVGIVSEDDFKAMKEAVERTLSRKKKDAIAEA